MLSSLIVIVDESFDLAVREPIVVNLAAPSHLTVRGPYLDLSVPNGPVVVNLAARWPYLDVRPIVVQKRKAFLLQ
jgi:hypothetical protein